MTTLNNDGFIIDSQDLSVVSPGSSDHTRVFNHDGSATITLTDGSTTSNRGWYMWDNPQAAWFPMGQHADLVDGYHGADLAALAENESVTGAWDFGTNPTVGGTNVLYHEGHVPTFSEVAGTATEDQLDFKEVPVSINHTKWADGLLDEEIIRYDLETGEVLEVHRLDLQLKGGGSLTTPSNFTIEVYDVTNATVVASDSADGTVSTGNPLGSSGSGATCIVRMTNSSGSYQNAGIGGRLHIV